MKKLKKNDEPEEKASEPSSKRPMVIVVVAVVVVVLVVMGAGGMMIWSKMAAVKGKRAAAKAVQTPKPAVQQSFPPVYALETFIVPLASPESHRFLRATLALELGDDKDRDALRDHLTDVREAIHDILPQRTVAQIVTTEGKTALRDEILKRVRAVLPQVSVTNLYYVELVVE